MHEGRWAQPRVSGFGVSTFAPETVEESRVGICHHPHPTRRGAEVSGFFAFTSHSRIGSQVHLSLHPARGEEERQCGRARGEWEKPSTVGCRPRRNTERHKKRLWGPGNPSSPPCGHANGGWLEEALDPSLPCRSCGRSGLELSRDRPHWHGWHHGATLSWGQVHGKEVESRKCSTGEGRGIMVLK